MQKFLKFITLRLYTAQHVSGVLTSIIRRSTTGVAASGFTVGSSAVDRGRACRPDHDQQHCYNHVVFIARYELIR
jgi:hypothetical protein